MFTVEELCTEGHYRLHVTSHTAGCGPLQGRAVLQQMEQFVEHYFQNTQNMLNFLRYGIYILYKFFYTESILSFGMCYVCDEITFASLSSRPSRVSPGSDAICHESEQHRSNRTADQSVCVSRCVLTLHFTAHGPFKQQVLSVYVQHHQLFALWNAKLEHNTALLASLTHTTFR